MIASILQQQQQTSTNNFNIHFISMAHFSIDHFEQTRPSLNYNLYSNYTLENIAVVIHTDTSHVNWSKLHFSRVLHIMRMSIQFEFVHANRCQCGYDTFILGIRTNKWFGILRIGDKKMV